MDYKDYYKILGVDKKADEKTIKDAYRKLAKKYHPDYNQGNKKSEDKFKEINEANEVLSDKGKREKYDTLGSDWQQYAQQGQQRQRPGYTQYTGNSGGFEESAFGDGGFSDFFRTFFGGGRGANPGDFESFGGNQPAEDNRRGDVEAKIELELKDAFLGGDRTFQLSMQDECYSCGGRGVLGRNQSCSACAGNGIIIKNKKITVKIPAGIKDGSKIRISGQGNKTGTGRAGDLYLVVKVRPHQFFEIDGNNIVCEVPVTVSELVLGANIEVPTFKNKVTIKVPPRARKTAPFLG